MNSFFLLDKRRYPALDGLRAVATVMIFNVHFFAQFSESNYFLDSGSFGFQMIRTFHSGSLGVDILFLLSGCLTYLSFSRNHSIPVHTFMAHRFKRLLPVILVVNLPALCWGVDSVHWRQLVDNIFFFKFFPETTLVSYITWALIYEMWFYVFFCAVFILPQRWAFSRGWTYFWIVNALLVANTLHFNTLRPYNDPRFFDFMVGILLTRLLLDTRLHGWLDRLSSLLWLPGAMAILAACWLWSTDSFHAVMASSQPSRLGFHLLFAAATAALFWRLLRPGTATTLLSFAPLRVIGVVSYSLFMTHAQWGLPISKGFYGSISSFPGVFAAWSVSFGVSLLLAALLFTLLERPYFVKP